MSDLVWAALVAAVPPTLTVMVTARKQGKKLEEVHELANSRLTEALAKIETLNLLVERRRASARKKGASR